jgi:alpha-tubulin suppressor-like RCC1 family protein
VIAFASIEQRCAVTTTGRLYCWGGNEYGAVGDGSFSDRANPVLVAPSTTFSSVFSGVHYACAVSVAGEGFCWGGNADYRTVGNGSSVNENAPRAVVGGLAFRELSLDHYFTCGVTVGGKAHCWGNTPAGLSPTPSLVTNAVDFLTVSIGMRHACGITVAADVLCWGQNTDRQLGDTVFQHRSTPGPLFVPLSATAIAAGHYHTCAVGIDGGTYCWGRGQRDPLLVPGGHRFTRLTASATHTCGLTSAGEAFCWGANGSGQLGDGTAGAGSDVPVPVQGGLAFRHLSAHQESTCGVTLDHVTYCWGRFLDPSVPTLTSIQRARPTALALP